jgi:hypothetical protein
MWISVLSGGVVPLFVMAMEPNGVAAFCGWLVWLSAPYIIMCGLYVAGELAATTGTHPHSRVLSVFNAIVSGGGTIWIAWITFVSKDAQSALGLLIVPIVQACAVVAGSAVRQVVLFVSQSNTLHSKERTDGM